ncbi:MAG: lysylphosphatidylglycerol synthase transmembrane domain-containing protein [Gemmatimonadota bacterium]|nr:lysylphosphatidylglycerol synthase transmembrane domain-containing protein [Gemmatimonadota bacterium]
MNRRALSLLKLVFGAGLLALLLFRLVDWRDVAEIFGGARPAWILPIVASAISLTGVSAYKWGLFLGGVSLTRLFALYLVGMFFNNFLPGSIGGDGVRSYLLGRRIASQGRALAGVFMERFTGFVAMVTLAAGATVLAPEVRGEPTVWIALTIMGVGCVAVIAVLARPGLLDPGKLLPGRSKAAVRLRETATRLHEHLIELVGDPGRLTRAMAVSYVFYFLAALNVWLFGQLLAVELAFAKLLVVTPIIMLIAALPLTPNNIGVWEWAFSVFLIPAGASPAQGLSIALAIRVQTLLSSIVGGLLFLGERGRAVDASESGAA